MRCLKAYLMFNMIGVIFLLVTPHGAHEDGKRQWAFHLMRHAVEVHGATPLAFDFLTERLNKMKYQLNLLDSGNHWRVAERSDHGVLLRPDHRASPVLVDRLPWLLWGWLPTVRRGSTLRMTFSPPDAEGAVEVECAWAVRRTHGQTIYLDDEGPWYIHYRFAAVRTATGAIISDLPLR